MIKILGNQNTLLDQFIGELRDIEIQKDRMRFRKNMERIGEIFAYEISKTLEFQKKNITTSLGIAEVPLLHEIPVLATILRAGLPLHYGLLNFFDNSENAFISAYRKHHKDGNFDIRLEYVSSPQIEGKTLILSDPMLATASSMVLTYRELLRIGKPVHTHIVTIIASVEGVENITKNLAGQDVTLWVGAIDDELTAQSYIVPGLGDAGDLAFGSKL